MYSITRSRLTSISDPLVSACGLSETLLETAVPLWLSPLPTSSPLLLPLSTLISSSWIPMSAERWLRTPTSTSLSSSSTLVMSPLVLPPIRSRLTSTTPARSSSGLSSPIPTLITAPPSRATQPCSRSSAPSPSTTLMPLMLSLPRSTCSEALLRPLVPTPSLVEVSSRWPVPSMPLLVSMVLASTPTRTGTLLPVFSTRTALSPTALPCPMPAHSCLLRLPSTSTAGVRTPSSLPSCSSTVRTESPRERVLTSTLFSPSSTTLEPLIPASTCTHSRLGPRSTNPADLATSPELITPHSSWCSPPELLLEPALLRSECMLTLTMF